MTTIISNRSIGGMHAFPGWAAHAPVGEHKKKSFSAVVGLGFFYHWISFAFFLLLLWNAIFSSACHINISCFSSPLFLLVKRAGDLLKILLYLFQESSSAGRTIDSSSFSFSSFLSFFCPDQHWRKIGRAAWSMYIYTPRDRKGEHASVHLWAFINFFLHIYHVYVCIYIYTYVYIYNVHTHTYVHIFSCSCLYDTNSQHVLTAKLLQREKKEKLRMGKVWKYCSDLNQNINPSKNCPLWIAKAFKEMHSDPRQFLQFSVVGWGKEVLFCKQHCFRKINSADNPQIFKAAFSLKKVLFKHFHQT